MSAPSPPPSQSTLRTLVDPVIRDNPITLQVLGVCSALAVTRTVATALVMSVSVTAVLIVSSTAISAIRNEVPRSVRLIIEITIIASLVIVVDQVLQAFFWELSRELSVFVGLIITNCVILGRAESFAMHQTPGRSLLDALGNGLGYSWILLLIGGIREMLGSGTLLGYVVLPLVENGGWFEPIALMLRPPSAFFLIGLLIWGLRSASLARARALESASSTPVTPRAVRDLA